MGTLVLFPGPRVRVDAHDADRVSEPDCERRDRRQVATSTAKTIKA
jgi:hypothetical protein